VYTKKDRVRVMIMTAGFRVEGDFNLLEGSRLLDSVNSKAKDFVALTDAKVFQTGATQPTYTTPFIAFNRMAITAIMPLEEG
jgi:hypothetical protein